MTDHIIVEQSAEHPGVQIIRFNRPEKKNAITRAMYVRMTEALKAADEDGAIRATAFLGTDGAFSAGNDIADFLAAAMGGSLGHELLDFLYALVNSRKPLVSGVDGLAIGIGTTMHMHCDLPPFAASSAPPSSIWRWCRKLLPACLPPASWAINAPSPSWLQARTSRRPTPAMPD